MIDFKKRALILTLAATVSVTGSFAADNYKNCLMGMEFKPAGKNQIDIVLSTKNPYQNAVSPIKKDANTYVIMLPETDNNSPTPNISEAGGCIDSVEVRKMPYSNGYKGYTKILIKTSGFVNLNASTVVYIPSTEVPQIITMQDDTPAAGHIVQEKEQKQQNKYTSRYNNGRRKTLSDDDSHRKKDSEINNAQEVNNISDNQNTQIVNDNSYDGENNAVVGDNTQDTVNYSSNTDVSIQYLLGLLVILIMMISAYFYLRAQDKLTNAMGEKLNIDVNDEPKDNKETSKKRKIQNTINKLDDIYSKSAAASAKEFFIAKDNNSQENQDISNVVDLDALFKEEQAKKQDDSDSTPATSDALDEFLKGFLQSTPDIKENIETTAGYDEEAYEKLLNNKDILFSKDDLACFNELLQSELSDTVMDNIEKYAVSNPIENNKSAKEKLLENIVTDYAITQNITFSSDDISIIKKLISVELDSDFISDLRTNPDRADEMVNDMKLSPMSKPKPSEILTLSVKDLLPNLSDALKKQGNKPIESEVKPNVVYYSEGYEVSTLSQDFDLPDLAKEIKNKRAYISKPSAKVEIVDQSYTDSVQKLSISGLPDLKDVVAHPEKYEEEKKETPVANENALLNSIKDVQFKPFDDGTRSFEIINDFEEDKAPQQSSPTVADIQREFCQFGNFEVAEPNASDRVENVQIKEQDDIDNIYDSNFVDLDLNENKNNSSAEEQEPNIKISKEDNAKIIKKAKSNISPEPFVPQDLNRAKPKVSMRNGKEKSEELMNMIDKLRSERINKTASLKKSKIVEKPTEEKQQNITTPAMVKCIFEGINYDIIASAAIQADIGCHLAKSANGYAVLSYAGSNMAILKKYDSLKNEKINVRLSDTLDDGTPRYIVKVGSSKFIVELRNGQAKYVMDLC